MIRDLRKEQEKELTQLRDDLQKELQLLDRRLESVEQKVDECQQQLTQHINKDECKGNEAYEQLKKSMCIH